jgi:hypothetical protein
LAEVIRREFAGVQRTALACLVAGGALLVGGIATGLPDVLRALAGLAGIVCLFLAWLLYGIYRMNRIVLTPDRLVVGRESFVRGDIDIVFGVQPPLVLLPDQQHRVEDLIPLPPGGEVRIVGGSWGRRIGTAMVVLRDVRTGQALAVFSHRPTVLSDRLTAWLTAVSDTPAELTDPDEPPD